MENEKRRINEDERFGGWKHHHKMTAEEAFEMMYGEKSKEYPEEMKKEFKQMYDNMKETFKKIHTDRKAFADKWKDAVGEDFAKRGKSEFPGWRHPHTMHPDNRNFSDFHGENY